MTATVANPKNGTAKTVGVILGITISMLTIIGVAYSFGVATGDNTKDHELMKTSIRANNENIAADRKDLKEHIEKSCKDIENIKTNINDLKSTQGLIQQDLKAQTAIIEKIEEKLP